MCVGFVAEKDGTGRVGEDAFGVEAIRVGEDATGVEVIRVGVNDVCA